MMTMNRLAGALLLALCTTAAVAQTAAAPAATVSAEYAVPALRSPAVFGMEIADSRP